MLRVELLRWAVGSGVFGSMNSSVGESGADDIVQRKGKESWGTGMLKS